MTAGWEQEIRRTGTTGQNSDGHSDKWPWPMGERLLGGWHGLVLGRECTGANRGGTVTRRLKPVRVFSDVVQVVRDTRRVMVRKSDGTLWGWARSLGQNVKACHIHTVQKRVVQRYHSGAKSHGQLRTECAWRVGANGCVRAARRTAHQAAYGRASDCASGCALGCASARIVLRIVAYRIWCISSR